MRNLLIFILVLIAIWWLRRAFARFGRGGTRGGRSARGANQPERMVGCAQCGLHVPESEGVRDGDSFFCCEEHRRLGARR